MNIKNNLAAVMAAGLLAFSQQGMTATTGLDFAGGCPETSAEPLCAMGNNATVENVAAILGLDISDVDLISSGYTITPPDTGTSGSWSLDPGSLITHIGFKANGYYVLGQVTAVSGDWMLTNPVTTWGTDVSLDCPVSICGVVRPYADLDFSTNGGQIADLSNTRAFSVDGFVPPAEIPVPAAVWLFGSGLLGLVGIARRRKV